MTVKETDTSFEQEVLSRTPVLVDLWAEWWARAA